MLPQNQDHAALAYLARGEEALSQGDSLGFELFEKACELKPKDFELLYRQGVAIFRYGSKGGKEKDLLLAAKKFKKATALSPERVDAWLFWGKTLFLLGEAFKEVRFFVEAEKKLQKALDWGTKSSEAHYFLAKVYRSMATFSGEAVDLQKALGYFRQCASYTHLLSDSYWIEYADAYLQMAKLLSDVRLIENALVVLKQAPPTFEAWKKMANALKELFFCTQEEDHFVQADRAFSKASDLIPYSTELFNEWAHFLLEASKNRLQLKKLNACVEKCQMSHFLNCKQPKLLAIWAEALSLIGELTDQVETIHEAQHKIEEALSLDESPDMLHAYGQCLYSWGNYFEEIDYYYQAIEQLQAALSIDRTRHQDWAAIAKVYISIDDIDSDADAAEKAIRFYTKALDLKPTALGYFEYGYAVSRIGEMTKQMPLISQSLYFYQKALLLQKNATYIFPTWLYNYAITLDELGSFDHDEAMLQKALNLFFQVLMVEPDFPRIQYRIGTVYSHLGETTADTDFFHRAIYHLRLALLHDEENDAALLEWGLVHINLAEFSSDVDHYEAAEAKFLQAACLGNEQVLYQLGCLYSLMGQFERAFAYIQKAYIAKVLPPLDQILNDDWLEPLRSTPLFQEFLAHLQG
jgi:tetratricopeptide (TPR) repeat protein